MRKCVYVCVCVHASSAVLVMLRQTGSGWVYFWVSDSVSMAADASERKALRYKQTLVSVPLSFLLLFLSVLLVYMSICLSVLQSVSAMFIFLCCVSAVSSPESLVPYLHDAPVLAVQAT